MAADMRSPNVSVTPINMEPPPHHHHHRPLHAHPHPLHQLQQRGADADTSVDAEVARIDFRPAGPVNMRRRRHGDGADSAGGMIGVEGGGGGGSEASLDMPPRPMSWEGELSDTDRDMCIDEDSSGATGSHQIPENLSLSTKHGGAVVTTSSLTGGDSLKDSSPVLRLKQAPVGGYSLHSTPGSSPLLGQRLPGVATAVAAAAAAAAAHKELMHKALNVPPTPSPDSAVHSAYSVFSSPNQSPLTQRHHSLTPSLSRNNSDASHSSCCSYSSVSVSVSPTQQFSPTHSPIQGRHMHSIHGSPLHHGVLYRGLTDDGGGGPVSVSVYAADPTHPGPHHSDSQPPGDTEEDKAALAHHAAALASQPGISRQQLINSPCPICGDKISGFHYGIFSCESCKGFFKRTVQNRKNYVCLRGAACPVTVATRKKCPACRFDKCLQCGMKLEAIREDRTRGGRSTYQCSYSLPPSLTGNHAELRASSTDLRSLGEPHLTVKLEPPDSSSSHHRRSSMPGSKGVPPLLQEIMDVEHLWHYNESELSRLSTEGHLGKEGGSGAVHNLQSHPLLAGAGLAGAASAAADTNPDFVANLCNIADHRLYKIVKWCKSLPLFKNISIDDQICLLINSWCELLLFSCCFRSMTTPGEIRVSLGKCINLSQARDMGMQACIERMLNFTEQLRRLRVDQYEYVAMKVIVLLTSDTSELKEAEKVRVSQEKALKALQDYTLSHYPDSPAKFGELLLRIPELQRTCQVGKEMLTIKSKDGDGPSFNLLMELLRGDH